MPRWSLGPKWSNEQLSRFVEGLPSVRERHEAQRAMTNPAYGVRSLMRDGSVVGRMAYATDGVRLRVDYVEAEDGPRAIGTAGMKAIASQLHAEGIKTVSGQRVSGIREAQDIVNPHVEVDLTRGAGDDQPRVPAGEANGGQWTRG